MSQLLYFDKLGSLKIYIINSDKYFPYFDSTRALGIYTVNYMGCIMMFDPLLTTVWLHVSCPSAIASKFLVP